MDNPNKIFRIKQIQTSILVCIILQVFPFLKINTRVLLNAIVPYFRPLNLAVLMCSMYFVLYVFIYAFCVTSKKYTLIREE